MAYAYKYFYRNKYNALSPEYLNKAAFLDSSE